MDGYISTLIKTGVSRTFKSGSTLIFQGEIPRRGMMVVDGIVRVYAITTSGEERTVTFHSRGDIIPTCWLMSQSNSALFYYEAMSDVRVATFTKDEFTKIVLEDNRHLRSFAARATNDMTAALVRINGLEQSRAEEKVAFVLYYLMLRFGSKEQGDRFRIDLKLKQTMIAGLIGLSREATTKILLHLQKQTIIDYSTGDYIVNKDKLERFLGEDSFRELSLQ